MLLFTTMHDRTFVCTCWIPCKCICQGVCADVNINATIVIQYYIICAYCIELQPKNGKNEEKILNIEKIRWYDSYAKLELLLHGVS